MAFAAYCKISNIPGESSDKEHKGEIKIKEYSHQVSQRCNWGDAAGGLSAGGAEFKQFKFTHILDKATANLNLFCAKGEHIDSIVITVMHSASGPKPLMEYSFKKCLITEVKVEAGIKDEYERPIESVTFAYDEINLKYTAYDDALAKEGEYTAGWSLKENTAIA